jgi:hypothetical protein
MFKHPLFLKQKSSPKKEDIVYWVCLTISGLLIAWVGYWLNDNELCPKSYHPMAFPIAGFFFLMTILLGGMIYGSIPQKWKIGVVITLLIIFSLASIPWFIWE